MKNKLFLLTFGLIIASLPFGFRTPQTASAQTNCVITSFVSGAPNNSLTSGGSTILSWNASGCNYVTLTGGSLTDLSPRVPSGYTTVGPITTDTTYTLIGHGNTSTSAPSSITITLANDVITAPATNVGSSTARLNGIILNASDIFTAYFNLGTSTNFDRTTVPQGLSPVNNFPFSDTVNVLPNTTYYYQAVVRIGQTLYKGSILSFTTPSASTNVVYAGNGGSGTGTTSNTTTTTTTDTSKTTSTTTASANPISLTISNQSDKITIGDMGEYTVAYANNSGKKLSNVTLSIVFPLGFEVKQATAGVIVNPSTVTVDIKTLALGETGSVYMQVLIGKSVSTNTTLVTNATLEYVYPNGTHDSTVAYVINHASRSNVFAGFTLGSGFFPTTIFGWLLTIIIILVIVLVARRIAKSKNAGHGGGHH